MAHTKDKAHKMTMNLANNITIARIISVPFFIAAVAYARLDIALVVFILAVISDGVDGLVARTFKQKTEFGTILDPIADKLLLISAYICLTFVNTIPQHLKMPPYVPIIVISRDVIIIVGSVIVYLVKERLDIVPSSLGKITTFLQMMTIVCILTQFSYSHIVWNLTVLFTIFSGVDYIVKGSKFLSENNSNKTSNQVRLHG